MEYKSYAVYARTREEAKEIIAERQRLFPGSAYMETKEMWYRFGTGSDGGLSSTGHVGYKDFYVRNNKLDYLFDTIEEWREYIGAMPESWYIKVTSENKPILQKYVFFGSKKGYNYTVGGYYGIGKNGVAWGDITPHGDAKEITIAQFERHMSSKKKEILGYKSPKDLFRGKVKEGELYIWNEVGDARVYRPQNLTGIIYHLPAEVVEDWEPVYEADKKVVQIGTPKFDVTIQGDNIIVDKYGVRTTKESIKTWLSGFVASKKVTTVFGNNPVEIMDAKIHIGCSDGPDVTLEELKSLIN